jgi:hypothetical protein
MVLKGGMYVEYLERSSKNYLYEIKVITSHFLQPNWSMTI